MTELTRQEFFKLVGGTVAWAGLALRSLTAAIAPSRSRRDRVARIVREYDSQGDHRTGAPVDTESSRWLAQWVRAAGVEPDLEAMPFSRIDVLQAYVEVGERWAEGLPLFDGSFTDTTGIAGQLGTLQDPSPTIGVVRAGPTPNSSTAASPIQRALRASSAHSKTRRPPLASCEPVRHPMQIFGRIAVPLASER